MKPIILMVLLMQALHAQAGWFGPDKETQQHLQQRVQQYEQQLTQEQKVTDQWQLIAGSFAIAAVILFTVGTALGSKTRHQHHGPEHE